MHQLYHKHCSAFNWPILNYSQTSIECDSLLSRFQYNAVGTLIHDGRLLYYCPDDYYKKRKNLGIAGKLGHIYLLCVC